MDPKIVEQLHSIITMYSLLNQIDIQQNNNHEIAFRIDFEHHPDILFIKIRYNKLFLYIDTFNKSRAKNIYKPEYVYQIDNQPFYINQIKKILADGE